MNPFLKADPLGAPAFYALILGGVAVVALLTASLGLYSIMSDAVERSRKEIGVRIAVGATHSDIRRLVATRAARLLASGLGGGILLALWSGEWLEGYVVGISPSDAIVYSLAISWILITCASALIGPIRVALRTDPSTLFNA